VPSSLRSGRRVALISWASLCVLASPGALAAPQLTERDFVRLLMPNQLVALDGQGEADVTPLRAWVEQADETGLGPLHTFISAEFYAAHGDATKAALLYWRLVQDAASDPHRDTWGGSALVPFSLYRWLKLQRGRGEDGKTDFEQMSKWADDLLPRRLERSVFETHPILPSLPLFEPELYRELADVARLSGLPAKAAQYYLAYVSRVRSEALAQSDDALYRLTIDQGVATADRIALFRGRHLLSLGRKDAAIPLLEQALEHGDEEVKLEAQYLLVKAGRWRERELQSEKLDEVHRFSSRRQLAQDALLDRALLYAPGAPELVANLEQLIREYPDGERADDAMYWLARSAQLRGELDASLVWYQRVRDFPAPSQYRDRSHVSPALGLLWRNRPGDAERAQQILSELVAKYPDSLLRQNALFWLGRIAEDAGDAASAERHFGKCAEEQPYEYYGIRAQMHLADGSAARRQLRIENTDVRKKIRDAYRIDAPATQPTGKPGSVYLERVRSSLANGLYAAALSGEAALRERAASKRIEDFTFEELDAYGLLTRIAVMMALRQDALAAAVESGFPADRMAVSRMLGTVADWPLSMTLVHQVAVPAGAKRSELMRIPDYLKTAYPVVYSDELARSTQGSAASPGLLYVVMRSESYFYPAALSSANALGLFQFIPSTFDELDRQWGLLASSGAADWRAYLLDERRSIALGARWFAEKKLPAFRDDPLLAAMAHHSGDARVRAWESLWQERGWLGDVERMIDSFRQSEIGPDEPDRRGVEARNFTRQVMADLAIVDAAGLYPAAAAPALVGGR
jgi:soluble lytic murein transglycosylase-like protein